MQLLIRFHRLDVDINAVAQTENGSFVRRLIPFRFEFKTNLKMGTSISAVGMEVNRIRIALLRSGTLTEWMEDSAIRVLRNAGNPDYAKIYDAVATITVDGELYRVGIEYERSLKAFERYQEIASRLADERRIQAVLYLCPNYETLRAISHVFVRAPKTVTMHLENHE